MMCMKIKYCVCGVYKTLGRICESHARHPPGETNKAKRNSRLESKCSRAIRLAKVSLCKGKKIPLTRVSPGLFLNFLIKAQ